MRVGRVNRVHERDEGRLEDGSQRRLPRRRACSSSSHSSSKSTAHDRRPLASDDGSRSFRLGLLGRLLRRRLGRIRSFESLLEELVGRSRKEGEKLIGNGISILLEESLSFVRDVESVMSDGEGAGAEPRLLERGVLGLADGRIELLDKVGVRAGGEAGFLVEEGEDAELAFDHVDRRLVVGVVDEGPVDLLADVLLLLELEDVGVELEMWGEK